MMGWRTKLKGGDEYDLLTGWRRFIYTKPKQVKRAKRTHNKRARKQAREKVKKWL